MGYTHHWIQTSMPDDAAWKVIREDVLSIIRASDVPVIGYTGTADSLPGPADGAIHFDGVGADALETFRMTQGGIEHGFCKTAERPYDVIVAAIMCYLASITDFYEVNGFDEDDYAAGLALARKALPQHAERLRAPDLHE